MRTQLKPHNRIAYQKVMAAFETSRMTCICHPTGTGKSYIVAAVSEHFKRVLILAPGHFILQQQRKVLGGWPKGFDFATYSGLMNNVCGIASKEYDLIVLDEFHRTGAVEWGEAVDTLLGMNMQAKILGTTATPVRYLNNNRDMTDELFQGNIASFMSIAEAWNQDILPIPRYVSGLFRWDKTINAATKRIDNNHSLTDDEKRNRIFRLTNAHLHWELAYGMPAILRKHLDKGARRVIVFCGHIRDLEQMRKEVTGWFSEAGFKIADTFLMHSRMPDREQDEQMRRFEEDTDEGVKLMFSVNMLNEGIHVPNVNAVLMLRTTASRIIYLQQMGRCLTTANTEKPLVLDMVDNITTTTAIRELQAEFDHLEQEQAEREKREPHRFEVIDYTLGVKQLIDKLAPIKHINKRCISFEDHLNIVKEFCLSYGYLPVKGCNEAVASWAWLRKNHGDHKEVKALREQYGQMSTVEGFKKVYVDFVLQQHKLPVQQTKDIREKRISCQWSYYRSELINDPEIQHLRNQYSVKQRKLTERIAEVRKFCEENGRTPIPQDGGIYKKWSALNYGESKDDPRIVELRMTYQKIYHSREDESVRRRLKDVFDFFEDQRRLPRSGGAWATEKEIRVYHQLYDIRRKKDKHPVEQELLDIADQIKNGTYVPKTSEEDNNI